MQAFSTSHHHLKAVLGAASGSRKGKQNPHSRDKGRGEEPASAWGPALGSMGGGECVMSF